MQTISEMRGGNPAPRIEWFLDGKNVTKEVSDLFSASKVYLAIVYLLLFALLPHFLSSQLQQLKRALIRQAASSEPLQANWLTMLFQQLH